MRERQTIGIYKLDSIQIYFNGSLEIQEELIKKGLSVPLKTPLPIIYGNVAGYIDGRTSRLALRAALLDPERYGRTLDELGWTIHGRNIEIPREYAELKVELMGNQVILSPQFASGKPGYHLEKASYRGVSPTNWKNWAGFYLALSELAKMAQDLGASAHAAFVSWEHEKLPRGGGHEDTYYVTSGRDEKGIEPYAFSLCMGNLQAPSLFTIPMELPDMSVRSGVIVVSVMQVGGNLGNFISPLIVGYLADITGSYLPGFITFSLISLGLLLAGLLLPETGPKARKPLRKETDRTGDG